jgi:hypothetical protein
MNALEGLMGLPVVVVSHSYGLAGDEPLWLLVALMIVGGVNSQPAVQRWLAGNDPCRRTGLLGGRLADTIMAAFLGDIPDQMRMLHEMLDTNHSHGTAVGRTPSGERPPNVAGETTLVAALHLEEAAAAGNLEVAPGAYEGSAPCV